MFLQKKTAILLKHLLQIIYQITCKIGQMKEISQKILVVLTATFFIVTIQAQNEAIIDSLQKRDDVASIQEKPAILNQLAEAYLSQSGQKAESYASEAVALAEKNNNSSELAHSYKILSSCYILNNELDEALSYSKKALDIFLKNGKIKEGAEIYNQLGIIYKQKRDFTKSSENFAKAIDYYSIMKDSSGIASSNGYLGSLYLSQNDYGNAIKYYQISLQIRIRQHDFDGMGNSYYSLGLVCREKGSYDDALQFLANALSIYEKNKNEREQANVLNLCGGIYLKKNESNKAIEFYQKSLEIREKSGNRAEIANSYSNLGLAYKEINNQKKALEYLNMGLSVRRELGDQKLIAVSYNYIGGVYLKSKNYNEALKNYLESLKISTELKEDAEMASANTNIGNIYFDLGNYDKSLKNFSEALAISAVMNDKMRIAALYHLMGNTYLKMKKFNDALDNYRKSLDIRRNLDDKTQIATTLSSIGNVYSDMGKFNEALRYYTEALTIRRKIGEKLGISTSLSNIGDLYGIIGNNGQSLNYFEQSLKLAEDINFTYNIALCSRKIGEIYLASKNFDKAYPYIEKSMKLSFELSNKELKRKLYYDFYTYFSAKNDYKQALENYRFYSQYNDSINASMTNQKLLDMQVNYEIGKKEGEVQKIEYEIAVLRKDKEISDMKDVRRKLIIFILLIVTLLVFSLGILYYNRYHIKRKSAEQLLEKLDIIDLVNQSLKTSEDEQKKLNVTKDKFFSIMAHDIKNPLGGLISVSDMLKKESAGMSEEDKTELYEVMHKTSIQLYNLLENLLHWSRSQTGKIPFNPVEIKPFDIAEINIELLKANAEKKNIMIINMIDHNISVKADKEMITLVMRNLLSNAIKFTGESGKIMLASTIREGFIDISVEDNGIGIPKDDINKLFRIDTHYSNLGTNNETGTGLGLILCKEFITKHYGKIWVESDSGKGAKFTFSLPKL